jgi:hypothetical protein
MQPLDPLVDYGIPERGYLDIGDVQRELLPDKMHELRRKLYQKAGAPMMNDYRRAGCGKTARPVRRGGATGRALLATAARCSLLYRGIKTVIEKHD